MINPQIIADISAKATYGDISKKKFNLISDEFGSYFTDSEAFIHFGYIGESNVGSGIPKTGWKFHITIDDNDKNNLRKAWDVIKNILITYKIQDSKVVKMDANFYKDKTQCGKQITLYYFANPDKDWQIILTEITQALVQANIKPWYKSPTDEWITGSSYITYRNDSDSNGRYVRDPENYNPAKHRDIIKEAIKINIEGQPERMEYDEKQERSISDKR